MEENKIEFDLIIYGSGLHASLLTLQAANKGLSVLLISQKDCAENLNNTPLHLVDPIFNNKISRFLFLDRLIKSLKKSFSFTFISSKTDHYQTITFLSRLNLIIYNLISKEKVVISNKLNQKGLSHFTNRAYKFSYSRISIALIKMAIKKGAKIHSYSHILSIKYTDSQYYNIQIADKINNQLLNLNSKCFLSFDLKNPIFKISENITSKNSKQIFYFTYPSNQIKLEKNVVFQIENHELQIIPWFDQVYFEFSNSETKKESLETILKFFNSHFTDNQINKSNILAYGTYQKFLDVENSEKIQLVMIHENKQTEFNYKSVNHWFDYSNTIVNLIIFHLKKGKKGISAIGKTVFSGNDLPGVDHPLRLMEYADEKYDQAKQILKSPVYFKKLFYRYGSDIEIITEKAYEYWNTTKNSDYSWLKAEIWFAIQYEFCRSAADFIHYRTEYWMEGNNKKTTEIEQIFRELSE